MSPAAIPHKGSTGSPAAKNGKSALAAKRNNSAHNGTPADCGPLAVSLSKRRNKTPSWFTMFAQKTAHLAGRPITFLLAVVTIVVWAVTGPMFGYSDTWQLVINTGTTIVTFLMVFLIQRSQNKDALAVHVKLNEIVKAIAGASNSIVNVEDLSESELLRLQERYQTLAKRLSEGKTGRTEGPITAQNQG
jgi:low affinity Fe/Cu permease